MSECENNNNNNNNNYLEKIYRMKKTTRRKLESRWEKNTNQNGKREKKRRLVRRLWNRSRNNPCFVVNGPIANLEVEIFLDI